MDEKFVYDGFVALLGIDAGRSPARLNPLRAGMAVNTTFRGDEIGPRPGYEFRGLDFRENALTQTRFEDGRFQGAYEYVGANGEHFFVVSVSGRLFRLRYDVLQRSGVVDEITITYNKKTTAPFTAPAIDALVTVTLEDVSNLATNATVRIGGFEYQIQTITAPDTVVLKNLTDTSGAVYGTGAAVFFWDVNPSTPLQVWMEQAEKWLIIQDGISLPIIFDGAVARRSRSVALEVPPGKQMAYGGGRLWVAGVDGVSFMAGDMVFGQFGTPGERYRDSVLSFRENNLIRSGGAFTVPAKAGEIRAMIFAAELDKSLGHGPLEVLCENMVFTCNAPANRVEWATVQYPIVSAALISNGGEGQRNTVIANSDTLFRSRDGIRSLILGRREFAEWRNTPQSRELDIILRADPQDLLEFGSAAVFDNRLLMTVAPQVVNQGVIHRGLVALDLDPVSAMSEKRSPQYDGLWTGLHIYQVLTGRFDGTERCFAFCRNVGGKLEFYEITREARFDMDDGTMTRRIRWYFESPMMWFGDRDSAVAQFQLKRLMGGEVYVADAVGEVDFNAKYRPDGERCWLPWNEWSICVKKDSCTVMDFDFLDEGCMLLNAHQPQPRNAMGLPQPADVCNRVTGRPYRHVYGTQARFDVKGYAKFKRVRVAALPIDQPPLLVPVCKNANPV